MGTMDKCLCCDNTNLLPYANYNKFKLLKCSSCQTAYTIPRNSVQDELYNTEYYTPQLLERLSEWMKTKVIFRNRINKIEKYIRKGMVLDFGCGNGSFLSSFDDRRWQRFGYDTSLSAMELTISRGLERHDFYKGPHTDRFFDLITMIHVIEHIENPIKLLERIKKTTKKASFIVIEAPNFSSFWSKLFGMLWPPNNDIPRHLNHFSEIGLNQLMKKAGYRKLENTHSMLSSVLFTSYLFARLFESITHNKLISVSATAIALPVITAAHLLGNRDSLEMIFERTS